jgi:hypothetical protein
MTIKLASLRTDLEREDKGDWVEYPEWPGVAFKVSSLRKPAYAAAHSMLQQRYTRIYKGKPVPRGEDAEQLGKILCKHILQDWRGLDIPYSPDKALEVLTDETYYETVLSAVVWCAAKVSELQLEFVEEASKNSDGPSAAASGKAKAKLTG